MASRQFEQVKSVPSFFQENLWKPAFDARSPYISSGHLRPHAEESIGSFHRGALSLIQSHCPHGIPSVILRFFQDDSLLANQLFCDSVWEVLLYILQPIRMTRIRRHSNPDLPQHLANRLLNPQARIRVHVGAALVDENDMITIAIEITD